MLERRTAAHGPTFSPTGDRIAFFQETDKGVHLFTVRTDGKELRQITAREGEVNVFPRWSADGSFLYFFQAKPTVSLRRMPVAGGDAIEIGPWPWQSFAAVDPLGGRVAYRRQASDKTLVTVVHDRVTGRETTLANAIEPSRWSRDGRTIFGTDTPHQVVTPSPARLSRATRRALVELSPRETSEDHHTTILGSSFSEPFALAVLTASCGPLTATARTSGRSL